MSGELWVLVRAHAQSPFYQSNVSFFGDRKLLHLAEGIVIFATLQTGQMATLKWPEWIACSC